MCAANSDEDIYLEWIVKREKDVEKAVQKWRRAQASRALQVTEKTEAEFRSRFLAATAPDPAPVVDGPTVFVPDVEG